MKKLPICIAAAVVLSLPNVVLAQDQCADILRHGIWEGASTTASAAEDERRTNWACNASQSAGQTGGNLKYGAYEFKFDDARSSSSNACSWNGSSWQMSSTFSQQIRRASAEIAQAWSSCMNSAASGGRASIVYGADPKSFAILLRVRGPENNKGTARIDFVGSGGAPEVQCGGGLDALARGVEVTNQADIGCTRNRIDTPVTVTVNYLKGLGSSTLRLPAVLPAPPPAQRQTVAIRAVDYTRGDGVAPASGSAAPLGDVLLNMFPLQERPNMAEWQFTVPDGGRYRFEVEYAAEVPRPVDIYLNGSLWHRSMLNAATGGWYPQHQVWKELGIVELRQGTNVVRVDRSSVFPHLRTLRFTPVD